jgi:hypothetical protein
MRLDISCSCLVIPIVINVTPHEGIIDVESEECRVRVRVTTTSLKHATSNFLRRKLHCVGNGWNRLQCSGVLLEEESICNCHCQLLMR